MKRQFDAAEPELMDRPETVPAELERSLASLRQLNRYFGSYRLVRTFLRRWIKRGDRLRLLDLATGSGDIPRLIAGYAREIGAEVAIDAVDFQPSTVAIAAALSRSYPEIAYHCADVLRFQSDVPYDIVICSLALHHFSEDDAVRLLERCARLSRGHALVADLRRGPLATVGVYLLTGLLFRDSITKTDGRLSAERAFSFDELATLAVRAGWKNFQHRRFRFARQAIWMESGISS